MQQVKITVTPTGKNEFKMITQHVNGTEFKTSEQVISAEPQKLKSEIRPVLVGVLGHLAQGTKLDVEKARASR